MFLLDLAWASHIWSRPCPTMWSTCANTCACVCVAAKKLVVHCLWKLCWHTRHARNEFDRVNVSPRELLLLVRETLSRGWGWPGRKRQRQLLNILVSHLLSKMKGRWSVSRSSVYLTFLTHQDSLSTSLTLEWAGTNRSKRRMARRRSGREEPTASRATRVGTQWRRCWIRSFGCCWFATWQHCAVAQDYEGVFQQQGVRALQRYKGYNRSINEIYDKVHHINMLMSLMFTITYLLILVQNGRQESTKATLCTERPATRPSRTSPLRRSSATLAAEIRTDFSTAKELSSSAMEATWRCQLDKA